MIKANEVKPSVPGQPSSSVCTVSVPVNTVTAYNEWHKLEPRFIDLKIGTLSS